MRSFDLVMFDLDGTLVETAPEIFDATNDTLRDFALPQVTQQQVNDWIGHGTRELLIQALASGWNVDAVAVRASDRLTPIVSRFDTHYQQRCGTRSQLYPQVRESLTALRGQGVKLAVVTNKEGALHHDCVECPSPDAVAGCRGQRRQLSGQEAGPDGRAKLPVSIWCLG